jgi:type IX secretion system PorP/SprF family membrane protein
MKKSNSFLARVFPTFLMVVFAAAFLQLKAQDPSFSQFYNNPVYYNPGYIGLNPGLRTRFNYRDQWTGLPQDFKTYNFSVDMAERNIPGSGGLGLLVSSDKAGTGTIKSTNVGIGTAARIPLYENMVAQMGFMVSYAQKSVNWDEMVFTDQLSARYGNIYKTAFEAPASNRVSYPDFSVGGVYRFVASASRYSNIQGTFGAAVHHVFTPNESFLGLESPLPRKLVITGDLVFGKDQGRSSSYRSYKKSSGGFKFNPAFQYEKQAEFSTLIIGMNILKSSIYFGGWIRNEDFDFFNATDAIFQVGVNAPWGKDTRMKIMYTYDYIIQTNMNVAGHGSHEISLVFEFDEFSLFGNNSSGYGPGRNNGRNHKEMECTPF